MVHEPQILWRHDTFWCAYDVNEWSDAFSYASDSTPCDRAHPSGMSLGIVVLILWFITLSLVIGPAFYEVD